MRVKKREVAEAEAAAKLTPEFPDIPSLEAVQVHIERVKLIMGHTAHTATSGQDKVVQTPSNVCALTNTQFSPPFEILNWFRLIGM